MTVELIHGDCCRELPKLAAGSVKMAFVDLPYSNRYRKATDCNWDTPLNLSDVWKQLLRVCSGPMVFTATQPFASILVASNYKLFRYDLIWDRVNPQGHLNANRAPLRRHEHLLVFCKNTPTYNPQKTKGMPYVRKHGLMAKAFAARQKQTKRIDTKSKGERFPVSILPFARGSDRGLHPTQKPVMLLEYLIKTYTISGDTILDPTAGSGVTAIAAMRTGRDAICIEKDAGYYDIMCKRVAAEQQQGRLAI